MSGEADLNEEFEGRPQISPNWVTLTPREMFDTSGDGIGPP